MSANRHAGAMRPLNEQEFVRDDAPLGAIIRLFLWAMLYAVLDAPTCRESYVQRPVTLKPCSSWSGREGKGCGIGGLS